MKRRKFIQATLASSAALTTLGAAEAAGTTSKRIFGSPASLTGGTDGAERMMLPLSKGGMPVEGWRHWSHVLNAIETTFSDPGQRALLHRSPQKFLSQMGLDSSTATVSESAFSLLVALADPGVQSAVERKDYATLLSLIEASGAMKKPTNDVLSDQIAAVLRNNLALLKERLAVRHGDKIDIDLVRRIIESSDGPATPVDIAAIGDIAQLVRSVPGELVVGAFAVVVAAVEAAVGVHAVAVVFTYAAVVNKVKVSGESPDEPPQSAMFNGSLSKLDPQIEHSHEVAARAGRILGAPGLVDQHMQVIIRNEVAAFLKAMRTVNMIDFDDVALDRIVDVVYRYGTRATSIH